MRLIDADNLFNNQILVVRNSDSLEAIKKIMDIIKEAPTIDTVSVETFEQFKWERDIAIEQLNEIGKDLGSKMDDVITVVRCKDCHYAKPYNKIWQSPKRDTLVCTYFANDEVDNNFFCGYAIKKMDEVEE